MTASRDRAKGKEKGIPQRTCVGCRRTAGKSEFVRLICTPEGVVAVDSSARFPGRGAYLCFDCDCLSRANKRGGFSKAFKTNVEVDEEEIEDRIRTVLRERILGFVGLAMRAGSVVSGSEMVRKAARRGEVEFILVAGDASASIRDRVIGAARAGGIAWACLLSRESLGSRIGKSDRSAIGIRNAELAGRIRSLAGKYERLIKGE
ncbi:DUF448 domain-containing protein [Thermodesulfobacteriota bacterium]